MKYNKKNWKEKCGFHWQLCEQKQKINDVQWENKSEKLKCLRHTMSGRGKNKRISFLQLLKSKLDL